MMKQMKLIKKKKIQFLKKKLINLKEEYKMTENNLKVEDLKEEDLLDVFEDEDFQEMLGGKGSIVNLDEIDEKYLID